MQQLTDNQQTYYKMLVPKLVDILSPVSPTSSLGQVTGPVAHRRAASFTVARLMGRKASAEIVTPILRDILCKPFITISPLPLPDRKNDTASIKTVSRAILLMSSLFVTADPSPVMIHLLLSPIIVPLYSLVQFLDERRGAVLNEPGTRELGRGLVLTWARVSGSKEAIRGWWNIIQGFGGWALDGFGRELDKLKEWAISDGELIITKR